MRPWRSFVATACLMAGAAVAQSDDARRTLQTELFAAMIERPDDAGLMLDYAQASIAIEDYEAAISTLERALIFKPDDAALRLELGAAYFRLGSLAAAQAYFESARDAEQSQATLDLIDEYLRAIAARSQKSRFTGTIGAGLVASSNATLGPNDRVVRFFGLPATVGDSFRSQSDQGFRTFGAVRHSYDLGKPNLDAWQTDADFFLLDYFDTDAGDLSSFALSTGPSLGLDDRMFGPRARPFVGARIVRSDSAPLFNEFGAGVDLSYGIDRRWSVFGRAGLGYRDYLFDRDDYSGMFYRGVAGAAYTIARGATVFATTFAETDRTQSDSQTSWQYGLRLSGALDYAPGFEDMRGLWTLNGYVQVSGRDFKDPDPVVDPNRTRSDTTFRAGVGHLFRIRDGFGLLVDVEAVRQDSNIGNFDFDNVTAGVSAIFEF